MSMVRVGATDATDDGAWPPTSLGSALRGVVRWIPGDVLVGYGIAVVATAPGPDLNLLFLVAAVGGPAAVVLGTWSAGADIGWPTGVRAVLAAVAVAIWAGTVPGNGYGELDVVVAHPTLSAGLMAGAGIALGLLASLVETCLPTARPAAAGS